MNILFLCTGNSCRSQMAEGWAKHFSHNEAHIKVMSAGIESHGKNPHAIAVMKENGIDISQQESTKLTNEMIQKTDYIITVCGHADEHCPVLPDSIKKEHWPLNDPAKATGNEDEIMSVFRESCLDIKKRVEKLINQLNTSK